jgi:hypothetical protein
MGLKKEVLSKTEIRQNPRNLCKYTSVFDILNNW